MRLPHLVGAAAMILTASVTGALAQQQQLRVGSLECEGGKSIGFGVGSTMTLNCVFKSADRAPEPYVAQVKRYGLDLGFTEQTGFSWVVTSPTNRIGRGELAGSYSGVGANASVGVGVGGNFLVGGSGNSFSLQPFSFQGQTGLNVTAGVAELQLTPASMQAGPRRAYRHYRHRRHHR